MKILVIDDEKSMHVSMVPFFRDGGHVVESAFTGSEGSEKAEKFRPDLILLDLYLPDGNGLDLLGQFRTRFPNSSVIIMTAAAGVKTAVDAIKAGAEDYLQKPLNLDDLQIVLARYEKKQGLVEEVTALKKYLQDQFANEYLYLPDPAMRDVYGRIEQLSQQDQVSALILGETGTGKEHVAKLIHFLSGRKAKPFVELHCGALPETLMESELFGYEAGAFTDARKQKLGLFEAAHGGSIFLDEVGEMPLSTQAKLLKVLEEKKLRRLGSVKEIQLDVRVIAATNRDLEKESREGRFRLDLYYRLNVIPLTLPPLRGRSKDIAELARFFWAEACRVYNRKLEPLQEKILRKFESYTWPGNVRELKNVVNRMVLCCKGSRVGLEDVPEEIRVVGASPVISPQGVFQKVDDEKGNLEQALQQFKWNKTKTAEFLGVTRKTLFNKMKKHGL